MVKRRTVAVVVKRHTAAVAMAHHSLVVQMVRHTLLIVGAVERQWTRLGQNLSCLVDAGVVTAVGGCSMNCSVGRLAGKMKAALDLYIHLAVGRLQNSQSCYYGDHHHSDRLESRPVFPLTHFAVRIAVVAPSSFVVVPR